jgi:hypothetical protein
MVLYLIIFLVILIIGIIIYFIVKRNKNENSNNNQSELKENFSEIEKKNEIKSKNAEEMNELEEPLINNVKENVKDNKNIEQFDIKEKVDNNDKKIDDKTYIPPKIENNIDNSNKNNEEIIEVNNTENNKEPIIKKEEPIIKKEEPIIKKEEPIIKKEEPIIKKEEPIIKKEEPIIKKEEPAIKKQQINITVPPVEKPLPTLNNLINSNFNPKQEEEKIIESEEISVSQSAEIPKKTKLKDRLKKARMLANLGNDISVKKSTDIAQKANELEKVLSQKDHANTLPTLESEIIESNEVNVLEKKTTLTQKKKKSQRYFDENE